MKYSVGKIIQIFRNELISLYPLSEINSIIDLVFDSELQFSKIDIVMKKDTLITDNQENKLFEILKRLKKNEPIQYILGKAFFYDLEFLVSPDVLIPRSETEELVNKIINDNQNAKNLRILDIGTGSGCIAITLNIRLKNANIFAYDISKSALNIATQNAKKHGANIHTQTKDILTEQNTIEAEKFDIIVSNPPYITRKEQDLMHKNVLDFEPHQALFVENSEPLIFYKAICAYAKNNLQKNGYLYFEINEAYGKEVVSLMENFDFKHITLYKDLAGKDRMVVGKR